VIDTLPPANWPRLEWNAPDSQCKQGRKAPATMKNLPLSKVYPLLEPGPVVLLTTAHKGHANIMAMSWHMMVEFEPPLVACVVSNANHSFAALRAMRECVIAIPAVELAPKVVGIGNCSGRGWPTALSADPRSHQAGRARQRARPNHQHHACQLHRQTTPQCLIVSSYG
jgi:hypothetical protein